jgi:hypothetical protein
MPDGKAPSSIGARATTELPLWPSVPIYGGNMDNEIRVTIFRMNVDSHIVRFRVEG